MQGAYVSSFHTLIYLSLLAKNKKAGAFCCLCMRYLALIPIMRSDRSLTNQHNSVVQDTIIPEQELSTFRCFPVLILKG